MTIKFATGQVALSTTSAQIVAARTGRIELRIQGLKADLTSCLGDSGVTTSNGYKVSSDSISLPVETSVWGVRTVGGATVTYLEIYQE